MHETNIPRINITEAMVYIASTLGTLSFRPMPIALSYSTFFTELLIHGAHTISNAAREFLIRVIIYPSLLHRILTPYLDHEVPADEVIQ